jgi:hypothetical protein
LRRHWIEWKLNDEKFRDIWLGKTWCQVDKRVWGRFIAMWTGIEMTATPSPLCQAETIC